MVTSFLVCVCPDGHKVQELCCVPTMEPFWVTTDQIATDEDVENAGDERRFLPHGDTFLCIPLSTKTVDGFAHTPPVFVQLFISIGNPSPPLLDDFVLLTTAEGFHSLARIPDLLPLPLDGRLKLLKSLGKGQILK